MVISGSYMFEFSVSKDMKKKKMIISKDKRIISIYLLTQIVITTLNIIKHKIIYFSVVMLLSGCDTNYQNMHYFVKSQYFFWVILNSWIHDHSPCIYVVT